MHVPHGDAMLKINKLTLYIPNQRKPVPLIQNLSFNLATGHMGLLVGASGVGKTTLLRTIVGLQNTYEGTITIADSNIRKLTRQQRAQLFNYVPQEYPLINNLTVSENITQPLVLVQNYNKQNAQQEAIKSLEQLGINKYADQYPAQLSGGQRQRARLAVTLATKPQLLVLDEPTSALDKANTENVARLLQEVVQNGTCVLVSTQDEYLRQLLTKSYNPIIINLE